MDSEGPPIVLDECITSLVSAGRSEKRSDTRPARPLNAQFGRAQLFFHSEQNTGGAWLIAERGRILRRWITDCPEPALGEPFGVERRPLDAYGITDKPENLDSDSDSESDGDLASSWAATWGNFWATTVAEESSIDPTIVTETVIEAGSTRTMQLAVAPPIR
ncbi:hypothetical protein ACIQI8_28780 [Streptomyces sp. NPDC092369]|uniref:hypothetical protein n=1 Tax=Streptomyces sp. NPDC092369 TaxID=3366015 RepID=UPI003829571A